MSAESAYLARLHRTYFDRYQRFRAAADLVHGLDRRPGLRLLDIGSFDQAFAGFVPGHSVRGYDKTVAPGAPLPYSDGFFDVTLALDVLEHVAPDHREFFIAEAARVGRLACILSFPIAAAEETERFVLDLTGNAWLAEHRTHGLPDPARVESLMAGLGLAFERHPNACLASWMPMTLLCHRQPQEFKDTLSEFFNRNYYEVENREPAYRYVYLCTKKEPGP
jgi:hypothetical protein